MPKFYPGDRVTAGGRPAVVRSWPESDVGPYVLDAGSPEIPHFISGFTGVPKKKDDVYEPAEIVLVERSNKAVVSTAGSLEGLDINW